MKKSESASGRRGPAKRSNPGTGPRPRNGKALGRRKEPARHKALGGDQQRSGTPSLSTYALDEKFAPLAYAAGLIRSVPDFPEPGILFRDITPLLADARAFHAVIDALTARFVGEGLSAVVAIESRGFIFGAALAARLNLSFVPVRKPGKLPGATDRVSYSLEYGRAELEMHRSSLTGGDRVLVIDDLLATGGTANAAAQLVERQGATVVAFAFVIELEALGGRKVLGPNRVLSLIRY